MNKLHIIIGIIGFLCAVFLSSCQTIYNRKMAREINKNLNLDLIDYIN